MTVPGSSEDEDAADEDALKRQNEELRNRLREAEETLEAIRNGEVDAVIVSGADQTPRVYTLETADRSYRRLVEEMQEGAVTITAAGEILYCNPKFAQMLEIDLAGVIGGSLHRFVDDSDWAVIAKMIAAAGKGEFRLCGRDNLEVWTHLSFSALEEAQSGGEIYCCVITDLTEQRRTGDALRSAHQELVQQVSERERTEQLLRQSQKMEAVGQLTGGLAHDFNNLLTGIMGSLEMMRVKMSQGKLIDLERYIDVAQGAARRAASLTQRLLAFARRQTLDPKPVDTNRLIAGMEELIRRTIGPSVELEVVGSAGLWSVLVDPPQLESALLNLCINARDAMPQGGRLTIETANKWLDERASSERDLPPGQYISLCVTDTGTGMSREIVARAFDPFFTTKPLGEGTGLGLSMIYGFARQSGGQVRIYSEIDKGTTVCIYLPRNLQQPSEDSEVTETEVRTRGEGEVVLVVDDEPSIRMLVGEVLAESGYAGIDVSDGAAGLRILQSKAKIDLLVTDVGLPGGMNGRQLADAGRALRPELKVLFITGYAENAVLGNGLLDSGMHMLTKPFAMELLARKIREILET